MGFVYSYCIFEMISRNPPPGSLPDSFQRVARALLCALSCRRSITIWALMTQLEAQGESIGKGSKPNNPLAP